MARADMDPVMHVAATGVLGEALLKKLSEVYHFGVHLLEFSLFLSFFVL